MTDIARFHCSSGSKGKPIVVGYTATDLITWSEVCARSLACAGVIAEDVIQIPVIGSMLANLNEKGEPDSVNYDRVAVALIPLLKEHEARLNKLEGK